MTNYRQSSAETASANEVGRVRKQSKSPADLVSTTRKNIVSKTKEPHILTNKDQAKTLITLQMRLDEKPEHYKRLKGINEIEVRMALKAHPELMWSLYQMEQSGGAPDIIAVTEDFFIFADCSAESPEDRTDLTYDQAAEIAEKFGVEMMPKEVFRAMQNNKKFGLKTKDWLRTSPDIREAGYAVVGGRVGGKPIVGKVLADNHDSSRGWRGVLKVPRR